MKKFKEWFLNNFVSIIGVLAPLLSGIVASMWRYCKQNFTTLDWILIGITSAESLFFIIFSIWRGVSYKSYHYSASKISPDYITIHKVVKYKITEKNNKTYLENSIFRKIKCSSEHLNTIPAKFVWTGNGNPGFKINEQGTITHPTPRKRGIWTFFHVDLQNSMLKGDKKDIELIFDPIANYTSSEPFVSTSTEEPNKEIIFEIDLGTRYAGQAANFEIYRASESHYPIHTKSLQFDYNGQLKYKVPYPKRFRRYAISWNWLEDGYTSNKKNN